MRSLFDLNQIADVDGGLGQAPPERNSAAPFVTTCYKAGSLLWIGCRVAAREPSIDREDDFLILTLDDMQQSAVCLESPTRVHFDYMRRMADVIDRMPAGPLRILHIGGAAMSLPRYIVATRPRSSQIVLEPDASVIDLVRKEAPMPPKCGVKIRNTDGLTGIAAVRNESQQVVILDAFSDGEVPDELTSGEFFAQLKRVMTADGVFLANIIDTAPFPATREFVASAAGLGAVAIGVERSTLKGKRDGNVVVAAGCLPDRPFGSPSPTAYRTYEGKAVAESFGGVRR